ncbi:neutral alpha-glucosidase ab [Pseudovirgaria hyperparasitica]|uniref:alpha-glucosidase n=1 Tax=Pseudovirgaria hyperparasitica TaxID=470096 RepID=A0A6A6W0W8_9PEZI|nr:neutral alpha-glucosidase ab [Pseudovirgaria hyperparasitica]KAF2756558.1 neutral alpha-glucosidase ab [Pseudovirgaria hyperparasitica]
MGQSEIVPEAWQVDASLTSSAHAPEVYLHTTTPLGKCSWTFQTIRKNLFRTTFSSENHPIPPHPSAKRPATRLNPQSVAVTTPEETSKFIRLENLSVNISWSGTPLLKFIFDGQAKPLHEDLPFRSYAFDGPGIAHYTRYARNTLHVGLGEKSAPMDLSNRHFKLSATDCFGYDVYRTDPMYKHIPLLINATADGVVGSFSTCHSRGFYSVGSEMDGLWGHFKVYRQEHGGLEEYLIVGRTLQEVVHTYAELVGYPLLVPRWAFGYIAGGMKYSMLDNPRASEALIEFAEKLKKYDIPCSGFQMSSGYTVAETEPKTRNVFTWNRHRFPDPKGFVDEYHRRGIRLIANVKPYVLGNHPEYEKLSAAGAFFNDPKTGGSATARLWSAGGGESGVGGHLDFTSTAAYDWWYSGVRELRKLGIDCIWNDNNEWTVPDDEWHCALNDSAYLEKPSGQISDRIGLWGRSLNTELMSKSSHDACLAVYPDERPFVLTRSATAGSMRYCASTWSGDNVTSWDGMKGANALSLTASFCLLHCYGHDIGGFEGPQPSAELLVRWVQQGIYSPRFAINCFKTSPDNNSVGDIIEPWMYPEVLTVVRKALRRRYELIPYLYSLMLNSHLHAMPPQRWTGWGYESDPEVWTSRVLKDGETEYWLGDALLVGGVFEAGANKARMYLPKGPRFVDVHTAQLYSGGQWVEIESHWEKSIPVLARVGAAIPIGKPVQVLSVGDKENTANLSVDDYRGIEIFPDTEYFETEWMNNVWYEDDGVSRTDNTISEFAISYRWTSQEVEIQYEEKLKGGYQPPWRTLSIILPLNDRRTVRLNDAALMTKGMDELGRYVFESVKLR